MEQFKLGLKSETIEMIKSIAEGQNKTASKYVREIVQSHLIAIGFNPKTEPKVVDVQEVKESEKVEKDVWAEAVKRNEAKLAALSASKSKSDTHIPK